MSHEDIIVNTQISFNEDVAHSTYRLMSAVFSCTLSPLVLISLSCENNKITSSYSVIVRVSVVLKRTVVGD